MVTGVRPMSRQDLDEVVAIEAEANPNPWRGVDFLPFCLGVPESPLERLGAGGTKRAWVFHQEGVRGFACAVAVADEVELQAIAVDHRSRNKGIGTVLLDALVEWALEKEYRSLHLEVRAGNLPALALYRRFGFGHAGRRRAYYPDNGEDALLLSREL